MRLTNRPFPEVRQNDADSWAIEFHARVVSFVIGSKKPDLRSGYCWRPDSGASCSGSHLPPPTYCGKVIELAAGESDNVTCSN